MYELIQLTERDYYIDCPAKIGLIRTGEDEVALIDSGSDKDAGKKVLRILESNGWKLTAIFNTHSHADHIGGNRFLQDRTGCRIYARGLECTYTNSPALEPMGLYGGQPFKDLKHKFLLAQESAAQPLSQAALPEGMELLSMPGHSFDMVGFKTKDGTAYIADAVSSEETLAKYGIGYLWDAEASVQTLETLRGLDAKIFVPAHASVTDNIKALVQMNIDTIRAVQEKLTELCRTPRTFEEILKTVFDDYGLVMTAQQYVLIGSTIRSYLSGLYEKGVLTFSFEDNVMRWKAV